MTVHEDIITATSSVAGGRVYPVKLPITPTYPCIAYMRVGGAPIGNFSGDDGLDHVIVQFDIFTEENNGGISQAWSLRDTLHTALAASSALTVRTLSVRDLGFEEGTEPDLYHISVDYQIWRSG